MGFEIPPQIVFNFVDLIRGTAFELRSLEIRIPDMNFSLNFRCPALLISSHYWHQKWLKIQPLFSAIELRIFGYSNVIFFLILVFFSLILLALLNPSWIFFFNKFFMNQGCFKFNFFV